VIDELIVKRAWYEKQKQIIPDFHDIVITIVTSQNKRENVIVLIAQ